MSGTVGVEHVKFLGKSLLLIHRGEIEKQCFEA